MKIRSLITFAAAALLITPALAQSIEYDDMYFTSKDRKKLKEKEAAEQAAFSQSPANRHKTSTAATNEVYADRGQSSSYYSPRNQNPEFAARSNSEMASDDSEYFTSDYRYANASSFTNFNNSYSNWYNSPWVANNYWGSSIYGWNSPYYGSYYDTWGNPWMNPYYRSGWSSSFSFYWGNSWNYGWGNNFGWGMGFSYGNPYYNSWAGWGPAWGSSWGWGGGGWYRYPSMVIINNDYGRNYSYGKRGTQNGMVTRRQSVQNSNLRPSTLPTGGSRPNYNNSGGSTGGRIATNSSVPSPSRGGGQRQDDYYNRNWRSSRQGDTYGGSYSQPSRSSQSSGWNNNNSSQWNNNRSGGADNGRSGSYNSGGGATRSSAPASSGSNGRTRGRD